MRLSDAFQYHPRTRIYEVLDSTSEAYREWDVQPIDTPLLLPKEGYYLIAGKNILPDGTVLDRYIDMNLPERISDLVFFDHGEPLRVCHRHEADGDVISAVPVEKSGNYELFYSKINPELGINILRQGLSHATQRAPLAQDLAYILRDENRLSEAAEMFELVIAEGAASYPFTHKELANCYEALGRSEEARALKASFGDYFEKLAAKMKEALPWIK
jgi:tetratricopeptide (TPR) repeat protein